MSLPRFFCDNIQQPHTALEGAEAHHLSGVLRLKEGDQVELFDGKGKLARALIAKIKKRVVELAIESSEDVAPRKSGRVILAVSLAKGQRFDWLISKATELGVDAIQPTSYERTVKQGSGKGILERYNNLAVSAAKQCRRVHLPVITEPTSFENVLKYSNTDYPDAQKIIASLGEQTQSIFNTEIINPASDKLVFIGPEGGLTDDEEAILRSEGAIPIRLTDTILRIETAAIAIASILTIQRDTAK